MLKNIGRICYYVTVNEKEICIVRRTLFSYVCYLSAGAGLIGCINNNIIVSIIGFSIIFILMNIRMIVYYMLYKQYDLHSTQYTADGNVLSFRNPRSLRIERIGKDAS